MVYSTMPNYLLIHIQSLQGSKNCKSNMTEVWIPIITLGTRQQIHGVFFHIKFHLDLFTVLHLKGKNSQICILWWLHPISHNLVKREYTSTKLTLCKATEIISKFKQFSGDLTFRNIYMLLQDGPKKHQSFCPLILCY